jgi:hypothetical protein
LGITARRIELYLGRKHRGEKLRTIGAQFGIGDAAVAQSCKRFKLKPEKDRKLTETIARFERMGVLTDVETPFFLQDWSKLWMLSGLGVRFIN